MWLIFPWTRTIESWPVSYPFIHSKRVTSLPSSSRLMYHHHRHFIHVEEHENVQRSVVVKIMHSSQISCVFPVQANQQMYGSYGSPQTGGGGYGGQAGFGPRGGGGGMQQQQGYQGGSGYGGENKVNMLLIWQLIARFMEVVKRGGGGWKWLLADLCFLRKYIFKWYLGGYAQQPQQQQMYGGMQQPQYQQPPNSAAAGHGMYQYHQVGYYLNPIEPNKDELTVLRRIWLWNDLKRGSE